MKTKVDEEKEFLLPTPKRTETESTKSNEPSHLEQVNTIDFEFQYTNDGPSPKFPKSVWFIIGNEFCER